eukprot:TRINITY_DN9262_c0_g1_i1.p1 TRINITY_DN9262_c0_g1~~TRINITY_DN9262_c0_g1_i1.p1  ORF type:complete len:429 (-),score=56.63 TRINITY_DN9262_c0_g1_i1:94-1380(-)
MEAETLLHSPLKQYRSTNHNSTQNRGYRYAVLGKTGIGKSTLLNQLSWMNHNITGYPKTELEVGSGANSVTRDICDKVTLLLNKKNRFVWIYDCPGFSDTGELTELGIYRKALQLFSKHSTHGFIYVLDAYRLSKTDRDLLQYFIEVFRNDVPNVLFVAVREKNSPFDKTYCNKGELASILAELGFPDPNIFVMPTTYDPNMDFEQYRIFYPNCVSAYEQILEHLSHVPKKLRTQHLYLPPDRDLNYAILELKEIYKLVTLVRFWYPALSSKPSVVLSEEIKFRNRGLGKIEHHRIPVEVYSRILVMSSSPSCKVDITCDTKDWDVNIKFPMSLFEVSCILKFVKNNKLSDVLNYLERNKIQRGEIMSFLEDCKELNELDPFMYDFTVVFKEVLEEEDDQILKELHSRWTDIKGLLESDFLSKLSDIE